MVSCFYVSLEYLQSFLGHLKVKNGHLEDHFTSQMDTRSILAWMHLSKPALLLIGQGRLSLGGFVQLRANAGDQNWQSEPRLERQTSSHKLHL